MNDWSPLEELLRDVEEPPLEGTTEEVLSGLMARIDELLARLEKFQCDQ